MQVYIKIDSQFLVDWWLIACASKAVSVDGPFQTFNVVLGYFHIFCLLYNTKAQETFIDIEICRMPFHLSRTIIEIACDCLSVYT